MAEMLLCEAADIRCADPATREALWCPPKPANAAKERASHAGGVVRLGFPRGWPDVFKTCAPLKRILGTTGLRGTRCRVLGPPAPTELAAAVAAGAGPLSLRSFDNASRLAEAIVGYRVIKGFVVFERLNARTADSAGKVPLESEDVTLPDAGRVFVAVRHWWNCSLDGTWIDLTPPLVPASVSERRLLVESPLGEKEPLRPSHAALAAADALARALAAAGDGAMADAPCAATAEAVSAAAAGRVTAQHAEPEGTPASPEAAEGAGIDKGADSAALGVRPLPSMLASAPTLMESAMEGARTSVLPPAPDTHSMAEPPRSGTSAAVSSPPPASPASSAAAAARRALEASGAPPASAAAAEAAARAAVTLGAPLAAAMRVASMEALRVARLGLSEAEATASAKAAVRQAAVAQAGAAAAAAARRAGASAAAAAAAEAAAGAAILAGSSHAEAAVAAGEAGGRVAGAEAAAAGTESGAMLAAGGGGCEGSTETLASMSRKLRSEGLVPMKAEDLSYLGAKVAAEEEAVRQHADEVRRARDRLARGVGDAADEVILLEDPPEMPTAEMMRQATGGRRAAEGSGGAQLGGAESDGGAGGGRGEGGSGAEAGDGGQEGSGKAADSDRGGKAEGIGSAQVSVLADGLLAEAVRQNAEGSRLFKLGVSAVEAAPVSRREPGEGEKQNQHAGQAAAGGRSCTEAGRGGHGDAAGIHATAFFEGTAAPFLLFGRALGCFEAGLAVLGLQADGSRVDRFTIGGVPAFSPQIGCGFEDADGEDSRAAQRLAARRSPIVVVRLLSNAAAAHLRLGAAASALACCNEGLRLNPTHVKLLSRRAQVGAALPARS